MEKNFKWWKKSLIYQIYPLSFKDSNDDGIGDLKGIISKLDYLKELGVDVLWLSPIYESPMIDNGYDIKDYYKINPIFGNLDDFKLLLKESHIRGMKLIMDLVLNHTSDQHEWFLKAQNDKTSKEYNYYIWNDKKDPEIDSIFSGSAWEYNLKTKSYYFHLFAKNQPDLNWENPELRKEIYKIVNYWLDLGVDGFRLDVIDLIGKDVFNNKLSNGPYLEKHLNELYLNCFKGKDIMTVGEMGGISINDAKNITNNPNLGLNMAFQFSHMAIDEISGKRKWFYQKPDFLKLKDLFIENDENFKNSGWNALFLSNHDQPRLVSRFGNDKKYLIQSSKMLFTLYYLQKGTPFIYQGEEIGMTGIKFKDINDYKDIETLNWYDEATSLGLKKSFIKKSIYKKGRDNSRTPFQWSSKKYGGFSNSKPWININPNYKKINAHNNIFKNDSIYHYVKQLFKIRNNNEIFINGDLKFIDKNNPKSFIYTREYQDDEILVVNNVTNKNIIIDLDIYKDYNLLLANTNISLSKKTILKPYATGLFTKKSLKGLDYDN